MNYPEACVREIKSIDEALKRLNDHVKKLREKKKTTQQHLYDWMVSRQLDEYEGYKAEKIAPKPKKIKKTTL